MSNLDAVPFSDYYAVRVTPQSEFKVADFFREKLNLTVSAPKHFTEKRVCRKTIRVIKPIISAYIFISANIKEMNWRLFYASKSVQGIVYQNGKPALIPASQVKSLEILAESGDPMLESKYVHFNKDERVVVVKGPLAGAVGNFSMLNEKTGRLVVSLDLFKRTIVTELDKGFIEPF